MKRIELDETAKASVALHRLLTAQVQTIGGLLYQQLNGIGERAGLTGDFWLSEDGTCLEALDEPAPPENPPARVAGDESPKDLRPATPAATL